MIKIFLYILLSLQSLEKKSVVIGLIPAENEDVLIPFEMVIHIAKKVDEILLKNENAQGSNDEQNESSINDNQNESSINDNQNEQISENEQKGLTYYDEQNEPIAENNSTKTDEVELFNMLKMCILAIIEYIKEEMEMNKKVIGMPRFDIVKIFDAIKNANNMNELKKKNEVTDGQRVEGSNDTVEVNVIKCVTKIPEDKKVQIKKTGDLNSLVTFVCEALTILYNKRQTDNDDYADIIRFLRDCFRSKVKVEFIKKHAKLKDEEFHYVDVVLNKKDEAFNLYLFLTKLFAETKKSYDKIYIFFPKITCEIKEEVQDTELKIEFDKERIKYKLQKFENGIENGAIKRSKIIDDDVQKEYYLIGKNLDIFQQGEFINYKNKKYSFTYEDQNGKNISVIIKKDNGKKSFWSRK